MEMPALRLLFLLTTIITTAVDKGFTFDLRAQDTELEFYKNDSLELHCHHSLEESDADTALASVDEIRVVKKVGTRGWHVLALVWVTSEKIESQTGIKVSGRIGRDAKDTFLKLTWDAPTRDQIGTYRCDLVGTDRDNDLVLEKTNLVTVFENNATARERIAASNRQLHSLRQEFDLYKRETEKEVASLTRAVQELLDARYRGGFVADGYGDEVVSAKVLKHIWEKLEGNVSAIVLKKTESLDSCNCSAGRAPGVSADLGAGTVGGQGVGSTEQTTNAAVENTICSTTSNTVPAVQGVETTTSAPVDIQNTTTVLTGGADNAIPVVGHTNSITQNQTTSTTISPTALQDTTTPFVYQDRDISNMTWPSGNFALLMPLSGCPETHENWVWETGFISYHTESGDENLNNASNPTHLVQPIFEVNEHGANLANVHFCLRRDGAPSITRLSNDVDSNDDDDRDEERDLQTQWPAGSYCIHRVGGRCPVGFGSGYVDIDEEDEDHVNKHGGALPDMLFFCCRKDGPASRPVALPSSKPFFLYRHGGQCQVVWGMVLTPENIILDTENENNSDGYENENHPDGHLEDIRFELCYYS